MPKNNNKSILKSYRPNVYCVAKAREKTDSEIKSLLLKTKLIKRFKSKCYITILIIFFGTIIILFGFEESK